jgi:hypothetical protein
MASSRHIFRSKGKDGTSPWNTISFCCVILELCNKFCTSCCAAESFFKEIKPYVSIDAQAGTPHLEKKELPAAVEGEGRGCVSSLATAVGMPRR